MMTNRIWPLLACRINDLDHLPDESKQLIGMSNVRETHTAPGQSGSKPDPLRCINVRKESIQ